MHCYLYYSAIISLLVSNHVHNGFLHCLSSAEVRPCLLKGWIGLLYKSCICLSFTKFPITRDDLKQQKLPQHILTPLRPERFCAHIHHSGTTFATLQATKLPKQLKVVCFRQLFRKSQVNTVSLEINGNFDALCNRNHQN